MELNRLSQIVGAIEVWPSDMSGAQALADTPRTALGTPAALVYSEEAGCALSVSSPIDPHEEDRLRSSVIEWLSSERETRGRLRPRQSFRLADGTELREWSAFSVCSLSCGISGRDAFGVPGREGGWVAVGTQSPLMDREVAVLQVVCRYLSGLAEVTRGQREISARDQFLSIASHELKTPLTSIYGILQLQERMLRHVQAGDENMDKQRSFLKIVLRQVERLNELINGLLDVSRLQNNRFSINPADSDIGGLLYETVNSRLNVIAEEASVRIQVDAPESFRAWVDPIRFEEVVTNLGMNAIRFSPEGGTVFIRLFEQGGQAIVHFRDQGPELAETDRHRIFRPFERAQRTARLGGLGLGLYISRQIAQLHGGDVTLIESVAGKGNLFEARFPLFPPEGGKSRPSA